MQYAKTTFFRSLASLFFLTVIAPFSVNAQEKLGLQNSNFSGSNAVYLNPANISTPGNIVYLNLWSRGLSFQNNYMDYNAPFKLNKWANGKIPSQYADPFGKANFQQSWLRELPLNGETKNFNFHQDIRALSLMIPVSRQTFISFNSRQRTGIQIKGLDENLTRIARFGTDNSKFNLFGTGSDQLQYGQNYGTEKGFKAHFESWQEYSFSIGGVVRENNNRLFSAGLTLKYLRGMGVAHISSKNLDFTVEGADSITFNSSSFDYAHSSEKAVLNPLVNPNNWFDHETTGHGIGFDLGITWMKKRTRNPFKKNGFWDWGCNYRKQYDWKFGAALMDIGFIQHGKGVRNYRTDFSSPFGFSIRSGMLDGFRNDLADGFDRVDNDLINNLPSGSSKNTFISYLPAALALQADFRLGNRFYLGINNQTSLKSTTSKGLNATSFTSFIPRIEGYFAEAALPITISNTFSQVNVGFFARFWLIHFGSDNLGGLLNLSTNSNFTGASVYGGLSIPIPYCRGRSWAENKVDKTIVKEPEPDEVEEEQKPEEKPQEESEKPEQKPDTVYITVKDTVLVETGNPDWERKEKEYKDRQRELEKRIEDLEKRPQTIPTSCADCEKELNEKKRENDILRRDLNRERDRIAVLERENTTLRDRIRNFETEKIRMEERLRVCENNRTTETPKIIELEKRIAELEADKVRCDNLKIQNDREKEEYTRKITALEKELKECRDRKTTETPDEELKRLRERITLLEKEKKDLEDLKNKCDETNRELTVRITVLEKETDKYKNEVKELQILIDNLNKETERLKIVVVNTRDSISLLKEKTRTLEAEKKKCEEENNNTKEIDELKRKTETLEAEKKKCDEENKEKETLITNFRKELDEKDKQIKNFRDSLRWTRSELEYCKEQSENIMREYQFAAKRMTELQKELKECNDKLKNGGKDETSDSDGNSSAETEELKAKLKAEEDRVKALEKQLDEQEAQINSLKNTETTLTKKLKECEDTEKNTDQSAADKAKIKELESEISKLETTLKNTETALAQSKNTEKELEAKIKACEEEKTKVGSTNPVDNVSDKKIADLEKEKTALQKQLEDAKKQTAIKEAEINTLKKEREIQEAELNNCKTIQVRNRVLQHEKDSVQNVNIRLQNDLRNCEDSKEGGQGNVVPGTNNPEGGSNTPAGRTTTTPQSRTTTPRTPAGRTTTTRQENRNTTTSEQNRNENTTPNRGGRRL